MSFTHSTSVFLAASVLAILAGCGGSNTDSASDTKKSKANPVTTSIVQVVEHPFHTVFRADAEMLCKELDIMAFTVEPNRGCNFADKHVCV